MFLVRVLCPFASCYTAAAAHQCAHNSATETRPPTTNAPTTCCSIPGRDACVREQQRNRISERKRWWDRDVSWLPTCRRMLCITVTRAHDLWAGGHLLDVEEGGVVWHRTRGVKPAIDQLSAASISALFSPIPTFLTYSDIHISMHVPKNTYQQKPIRLNQPLSVRPHWPSACGSRNALYPCLCCIILQCGIV